MKTHVRHLHYETKASNLLVCAEHLALIHHDCSQKKWLCKGQETLEVRGKVIHY